MANVTIDILTQFKGKPAFKQAESATGKLEGAVAGLAKKFAVAFSVKKIADFGVAAVKAFTEDQAAAARLAKTVDNLGIGFANPAIAKFIDKMTTATGVADDKLRPALQQLITTTGAVKYSQDLLTNAIDISRGSGIDLETVVSDLTNAYTGKTKAIAKYKTGLSAAELKTMSFSQIMDKLNGQFTGSSADYLNTYAGKLDLIKNAAKEGTEAIGHGLVDAFSILAEGSSGDITSVTDGMVKLAESIGDVFRGAAYYIKEFLQNPVVKKILSVAMWFWEHVGKKMMGVINPVAGLIIKAADKGKDLRPKETGPKPLTAAQQAALLKREQLARDKANQVLQAKALKRDKANALAKTVFDIEQIGLVAALKGKLSAEEELRVKAQLAILSGNESEATKLTNQILAAQEGGKELTKFLTTLPDANNPFKNWSAYLIEVQKQVSAITASVPQSAPSTNASIGTGMTGGTSGLDYGGNKIGSPVGITPQVIVTFQGADSLSNALRDSFVSSSMDGSFSQINRTVGAFDR